MESDKDPTVIDQGTGKRMTLAEMIERATPASKLHPMFALVALPEGSDSDGFEVVFVVKAVDLSVVVLARGGLPAIYDPDEDAKKVPDAVLQTRIEKWNPGAAEIAKAGVLRPELSFGDEPEDGKVWWHGLSFRNRVAVVGTINRLSGFGGEANKKIAKFPRDAAGSGDGVAVDAAGAPQGEAAVGDPAGV